jgi:hypothetical protein
MYELRNYAYTNVYNEGNTLGLACHPNANPLSEIPSEQKRTRANEKGSNIFETSA